MRTRAALSRRKLEDKNNLGAPVTRLVTRCLFLICNITKLLLFTLLICGLYNDDVGSSVYSVFKCSMIHEN
jgi:hypothetical protein